MQPKLKKLFLTLFLLTVFNVVAANAGTQYTYDANGNRITMLDSTGTTRYEYDAVNRLTKITNPSNQVITFTYDAAGRRTGMTYPNGMITRYVYDNVNRLINLSYHLGNSTIASLTYIYDVMDNCTSMTDEYGAHTYAYDGAYRLTQAIHPQSYNPTEIYAYDNVGNRNPSANVYNAGNQLVEDADFVYSYDKNGSTISKRDKSSGKYTRYYWNADYELTQIKEYTNIASTTPVSVSRYIYDGAGFRVAKDVNGNIAKYVYDGMNILLETDSNDKISVRYTFSLDEDEPLIMQRDTNGDGTPDTTYYYIADGLGNIVKLVDASGNVVNSYVYDSFGNIVSKTEGVPNRYTYTGREYDAESGLYYYRTRYYNAKIGRFINEDSIGFWGGINFYVYAGNNPVKYYDPYGLTATPWPVPSPVPMPFPLPPVFYPGTPANQAFSKATFAIFNAAEESIRKGLDRVNKAAKKCKTPNSNCPPCNPPVGTIGFRYDTTGRTHAKFMPHFNVSIRRQNPDCSCYWADLWGFPPNFQPPSDWFPR